MAGLFPDQKRFRIGYAAQSSEFAFSRTVEQSLQHAGKAAHVELLVVASKYHDAGIPMIAVEIPHPGAT